jgi:hypothetical protein
VEPVFRAALVTRRVGTGRLVGSESLLLSEPRGVADTARLVEPERVGFRVACCAIFSGVIGEVAVRVMGVCDGLAEAGGVGERVPVA